MSRKTSHARREEFFRALAETGNRTIAAERAKVSQSWVSLHRAEEPGFRARMEAAIAEARARLREARGLAPGSGWGSLEGEELVVRGTNGRRTQIARARLKQWTPRAEARFLSVLASTCNVRAACAAVGLTQASAYMHARRWPAFAARWDAALETGYARLEIGMVERACNLFSGEELPPELPIPPMRVDEAMQLLWLYQRRVAGRLCGAPGQVPRRRSFAEVEPGIRRKVEAIRRGALIDPEERARDEREWARRRE